MDPIKEEDKSRIFFGSSKTSRKLAEDLIAILEKDESILCIPWYKISKISQISFLEPLFEEFKICDFSVFIFGPDDVIIKDKLGKEEKYLVTRDNVIYEAGFSMGKIGKARTFLVTPDDIQEFHLLTDLSGFITARYKHEQWENGDKKALNDAANEIKKNVKELGKRKTICKEFDLTPEGIRHFYRMSRLTYAYMNRREAFDDMIKDIESARKSVEMYARVYLSELIKDPLFVSAIEKAIQTTAKENGLRIRHVSTDYNNNSLVESLWKKEDPDEKRWKSVSLYKDHLISSNAVFDDIRGILSEKEGVIFERTYLKTLLPFSMLSIDDEILYVSFYEISPKYGTHAPTMRLVCKENCKNTWVDLFLGYKQEIDTTGI